MIRTRGRRRGGLVARAPLRGAPEQRRGVDWEGEEEKEEARHLVLLVAGRRWAAAPSDGDGSIQLYSQIER